MVSLAWFLANMFPPAYVVCGEVVFSVVSDCLFMERGCLHVIGLNLFRVFHLGSPTPDLLASGRLAFVWKAFLFPVFQGTITLHTAYNEFGYNDFWLPQEFLSLTSLLNSLIWFQFNRWLWINVRKVSTERREICLVKLELTSRISWW